MNYIISVDQSTSATKAVMFNEHCQLVNRINLAHQQYYPQPGWVEHDAEEIYHNTVEVIRQVVEMNKEEDASYSLAITNQRETVVVWNKYTGKPVYHAVVWQCQRGADICNQLKEQGYTPLFQEKTILPVS